MYLPNEITSELSEARQNRYADTPLHSHEELEHEEGSILHKTLFLLIVLLVSTQCWLLHTLRGDLIVLQTEMLTQFHLIKPRNWQIVAT